MDVEDTSRCLVNYAYAACMGVSQTCVHFVWSSVDHLPADILIPNWSLSRSAAFDIKVRYISTQ